MIDVKSASKEDGPPSANKRKDALNLMDEYKWINDFLIIAGLSTVKLDKTHKNYTTNIWVIGMYAIGFFISFCASCLSIFFLIGDSIKIFVRYEFILYRVSQNL